MTTAQDSPAKPLADLSPAASSRVTPSRTFTLRGKKNLDWFFKNKRWVKTAERRIVDAATAERALTDGEEAIQIFYLAAKRDYRKAHDRNRIRRWLKAAVLQTTDLESLHSKLVQKQVQRCIMLRISAPISELNFERVLKDVRLVVAKILADAAGNKAM